jgi:voltage-gated potassium channel
MITHDKRGHAQFGRLEGFLQILILLNLIAFAFETLPDLSPGMQRAFAWFEAFSVMVFTIELVTRVALSRPPLGYVRSFMGVIDVLSVLPFYLSLGFDLRSIRVFRLLRVLRIFKLARYSAAVQRFHLAFVYAREELVLFGTAALVVLYLAAVGIYHFENAAQPQVYASVFHSLWWAIVTLTTVGYGDAYPHHAWRTRLHRLRARSRALASSPCPPVCSPPPSPRPASMKKRWWKSRRKSDEAKSGPQ